MFLKKSKLIIIFFVSINIFIFLPAWSNEKKLIKAVNYLSSLDNFSASFIQNIDNDVSEGKIFIGLDRVRLDYILPSKILVILDENKGMYYNYELNEDEFFNPRNTSAWFFFEIFKNKNFFLDSKVKIQNNSLVINKNDKFEDISFEISIYFEENPLILRKINLIFDGSEYVLSIFNHKTDEKFNKKFFKLINPDLLN